MAQQQHDKPHGPAIQHVGRDGKITENVTDRYPPEFEISLGQKMMSAVTGSVLTSLLVTPLDVVRVRLQSQQPSTSAPTPTHLTNASSLRSFNNLPSNLGVTSCCREVFWVNNNTPFCVVADQNVSFHGSSSSSSTAAAECAVEESQRKTFTSTLDGLRKIARNEGLTTLWRGLSPTLVMAVPANVIYFAGYDWLRTAPASPMRTRISDKYAPLAAGSTARVLAALVVSPIELFRTRMQAHRSSNAASNFKETMASVREMVAAHGVHTLWRGLSLTLWRDVPFSALYWWGYETTRNAITDVRERGQHDASTPENPNPSALTRADSRSRQNHSTTLVDSFAAGALSGFAASIVTTPFDVGKTRQQVLRHSNEPASAGGFLQSSSGLKLESSSMPRLLAHIFREEGFSGLFRGWAARCLKVAPACAIMISSYEVGKSMAQKSKMDDKE